MDKRQLKRYWGKVHAQAGSPSVRRYARRLAPVTHPDAPMILNAYEHWLQRRALRRALNHIGKSVRGLALDVGCGWGRWWSLVEAVGYRVVGVDVALDALRSTHGPRLCADACRLPVRADAFGLVTSVTLVQHLPGAAQDEAIGEIARVLRTGGFLIMLENVRDQAAHVFARSPAEYVGIGSRLGLAPVSLRPYDFSLPLQSLAGFRERFRRPLEPAAPLGLVEARPRMASFTWSLLSTVAVSAAVIVSWIWEPVLERLLPRRYARHFAMVFVKKHRAAVGGGPG
jgi:SAM-dependent methyltransferase